MDHKEAGQGTPFDGMAHEDMLAWLDKANSSAVQGASDRLVSAAKEIRKIAEELKVRPQMVEWKGEGADAFRTWSADLANATLRLGAYSEGASKWLAQASDAIASAQAAIPRTQAGAQANLDAARAARNDPDASAVAQKSAETLIASQESNRQEAAAQMRKLAQTYSFSASQMDGLEKPAFPPPPGAIVPEGGGAERDNAGAYVTPGGTPGGGASGAPGGVSALGQDLASPGRTGTAPTGQAVGAPSGPLSATALAGDILPPVGMEIAGAATLPTAPPTHSGTSPGVPSTGKAEGGSVSATFLPPGIGGGPIAPPAVGGGGRAIGIARPSMPSASAGNLGAGAIGRPPGDGGIVGGRPVAQTPGRSAGGLPRGTVIGGEGSQAGRGAMGHGAGMGGTGGGNQSGIVGGRRLAGETGGVVGGRPQQQGRTTARPFTPGGTGLVRGAAPGAGSRGAGQAGRGGSLNSQRARTPVNDETERPDYLVEDEETWQQGGRRVVPPVID